MQWNKNYLFRKDFRKRQRQRQRQKRKNEKEPTCAIFSESRGCKKIKYDNFIKMSKTKTKNEKDSTCAIFLESRGCNDIKCDLFTKKFSQNFHEIFEKYTRPLLSKNQCKKIRQG